MLVARVDEFGKLASARPDPASQLVAGPLPPSLRTLGHRAGPGSTGLLDDLPNCPRGFEGIDRFGLTLQRAEPCSRGPGLSPAHLAPPTDPDRGCLVPQ